MFIHDKKVTSLWGIYLAFFLTTTLFAQVVEETSVADNQERKTITFPGASATIEDELVIDNFDEGETQGLFTGRKNTLGQYQGTWAKRPSYSIIYKNEKHRRGSRGAGLAIEYKKSGGWCGWYTFLGKIDITSYDVLSFYVKGKQGKECFDIGMLDKRMIELNIDSVYAGSVDLFLPSKNQIDTEWQQVIIPLSILQKQVDLSQAGSIVFWFLQGEGTIYIDDMSLLKLENPQEIKPYLKSIIERRLEFTKRPAEKAQVKKTPLVKRANYSPFFQEKTFFSLESLPEFSSIITLSPQEKMFAKRGKAGVFQSDPSKAEVSDDASVFYHPEKDILTNNADIVWENEDRKSLRIDYQKADNASFCGVYWLALGDLSPFETMIFLVKGKEGGETFEIGINDTLSNKREDAVILGSIYRYLPQGITKEWQMVIIPMEDFFGPDMHKIYSFIFHFNEIGKGTFWISNIRFSPKTFLPTNRREQNELCLDNFDHSTLNNLGRKNNTYARLPSYCRTARVQEPHYGESGRSLRLAYSKEESGWTGYYSLLNQIDGQYYDLTNFDTVLLYSERRTGGREL